MNPLSHLALWACGEYGQPVRSALKRARPWLVLYGSMILAGALVGWLIP